MFGDNNINITQNKLFVSQQTSSIRQEEDIENLFEASDNLFLAEAAEADDNMLGSFAPTFKKAGAKKSVKTGTITDPTTGYTVKTEKTSNGKYKVTVKDGATKISESILRKDGTKESETCYYIAGAFALETITTFDEYERPKKVVKQHDKNNIISTTTYSKYSKPGVKPTTRTAKIKEDGKTTSYKQTLNEDGRPEKEVTTSGKNKGQISEYEYNYNFDDDGNDDHNSIMNSIKTTYAKDGKTLVSSLDVYYSDGHPLQYSLELYNQKNPATGKKDTTVTKFWKEGSRESYAKTLYKAKSVDGKTQLQLDAGGYKNYQKFTSNLDAMEIDGHKLTQEERIGAEKVLRSFAANFNDSKSVEIANRALYGDKLDDSSLKNTIDSLSKEFDLEFYTDNNIISESYAKSHKLMKNPNYIVITKEQIATLRDTLSNIPEEYRPARLALTSMDNALQENTSAGFFNMNTPDAIFLDATALFGTQNNYRTASITSVLIHENAHRNDYNADGLDNTTFISNTNGININDNNYWADICDLDDGENSRVALREYIGNYAFTDNQEFVAEVTTMIALGLIVKNPENEKYPYTFNKDLKNLQPCGENKYNLKNTSYRIKWEDSKKDFKNLNAIMKTYESLLTDKFGKVHMLAEAKTAEEINK